MFSLLEAGGLLGLVNYFLNPHPQLLSSLVAHRFLLRARVFPRRAWFEDAASAKEVPHDCGVGIPTTRADGFADRTHCVAGSAFSARCYPTPAC